MKQLTMEDIKPLSEYEAIRKTFQQEIIALKKRRRILLGRNISLVFENRETLLFQIQEMMRVEHIYDPARIRDELDTYNPLIAGPGELSATLFIEITESDRVKEILDGLQGIDNGRSVFIQLGPDRICGLFEFYRIESIFFRITVLPGTDSRPFVACLVSLCDAHLEQDKKQ